MVRLFGYHCEADDRALFRLCQVADRSSHRQLTTMSGNNGDLRPRPGPAPKLIEGPRVGQRSLYRQQILDVCDIKLYSCRRSKRQVWLATLTQMYPEANRPGRQLHRRPVAHHHAGLLSQPAPYSRHQCLSFRSDKQRSRAPFLVYPKARAACTGKGRWCPGKQAKYRRKRKGSRSGS